MNHGPGGPPPGDGHPRDEEPLLITSSMLAGKVRREPIDFERGMHTAPPFILFLIVANVATFAWELGAGALSDRDSIIEAGALVRDGVLAGDYWRIVSAMFLHGGFDHLLGNCLVLYIVGMACEHALGLARTATVYFASGAAGALLSMLMSPGPSVGASAAIFGVAAAVIVVLHRYRDRFHLRDNRVGVVLVVWSGYQVLIGLTSPLIDNFAHIGGFLGGAATALLMKPRLLSPPAPARIAR